MLNITKREGSLLLQGQGTLKEYNGNFRSNCTEVG